MCVVHLRCALECTVPCRHGRSLPHQACCRHWSRRWPLLPSRRRREAARTSCRPLLPLGQAASALRNPAVLPSKEAETAALSLSSPYQQCQVSLHKMNALAMNSELKVKLAQKCHTADLKLSQIWTVPSPLILLLHFHRRRPHPANTTTTITTATTTVVHLLLLEPVSVKGNKQHKQFSAICYCQVSNFFNH